MGRVMVNPLRLSSHHPVRKALGTIIVTVLASVAALLTRVWPLEGITREADWFIYDQLWKTRGHEDMRDADVAIIQMADSDLRAMAKEIDGQPGYGYPWPRMLWGNLVEYLAAGGSARGGVRPAVQRAERVQPDVG